MFEIPIGFCEDRKPYNKAFAEEVPDCKKHEGKSFATPKIPQLPLSRVSDEPPFTHTGLDFAGPLLVRVGENPKSPTFAFTRVHLQEPFT